MSTGFYGSLTNTWNRFTASNATEFHQDASIEPASPQVNWNDFVARQRQLEDERWERVNELREESTPTHAPMLCKKSMRIAHKVESIGRKRSSRKPVHQTPDEQECTFTPTINSVSATRTSRSLHDLSIGETMRRREKAAAALAKKQQDEMEGVTFAPTVNQKSSSLKHGRINVAKDPEGYMRMIKALPTHDSSDA